MKIFLLFFSILLISWGCKNEVSSSETEEQNEDTFTIGEKIAYENGFIHWNEVSEIRFTFNADRPNFHSERSWIWNPKSDDVSLITDTDTIAYKRSRMDSLSRRTDAAFINDKFWLLAPFNLVWDTGTTTTDKGEAIAPISGDTLHKVTITYGEIGGYTPGDAYDFYYVPPGKKDSYLIREWIFRKGNDSVPSMITTWEDYNIYKGVRLSTMHKDSTGTRKIYFTNISVE